MTPNTARSKAIDNVLAHFNSYPDSPYILKDTAALAKCHGLDREPQSVEFDAPGYETPREIFFRRLDALCEKRGYAYRIDGVTKNVHRVFLDYGANDGPLEIGVSYRLAKIPSEDVGVVSGIKAYHISRLAEIKAATYSQGNKIGDLYDVLFICARLLDRLDPSAVRILQGTLLYMDLEQFNYIVRTQHDPLIDPGKLREMFLESFDRLGLLLPAPGC